VAEYVSSVLRAAFSGRSSLPEPALYMSSAKLLWSKNGPDNAYLMNLSCLPVSPLGRQWTALLRAGLDSPSGNAPLRLWDYC
jgi:hypothetical protein